MSDTMEQPSGSALPVVPRTTLPSVLAADKNDLLKKLQDELAVFKADISTPAGRKAVASMAHKVARIKGDLLKLADRVSEEARRTHKAIVEEKKIIEDRLNALRDAVRAPLDEYEAAEELRVRKNLEALEQLQQYASFFLLPTPDEVQNRIEMAAAFAGQSVWDIDFRARASDLAAEVLDKLAGALIEAKRREAMAIEDAARRAEEAERQRIEAERIQREREEEIARAAAQQARLEAERSAAEQARLAAEASAAELRAAEERAAADRRAVEDAAQREREAAAAREREHQAVIERAAAQARQAEADKLAAEQRAEQERIAAERREAEAAAAAERRQAEAVEAERQRAEQERKRQEDEAAETKRKQELEDKRRAENKAHRQRINKVALDALILCGLPEEMAKVAIVAIARGDVPNVSIAY